MSEVTPQGAITYAYDPASRRQTMQANGLQPVTYGYDAASRLTGITQGQQAATLDYDSASRRTSLVLPNGITVTYTYDESSRLIAQTYSGPSGALGDLSYTYDANGNRIATGGSWARSGIPTPIATSSYDTANQQLQFGDMAMTFDANGNLLTQTDASGTTTYTWDARNRLVAINGPTVNASFAYDALGRRTVKTINGESSSFLYDVVDVLKESGPSGDAAYLRTLAIDEALARTDANGTVTYLTDILGSTVALSDPTGVTPTTYTYAPFGDTAVSGLSPNPFQFTGRENDGTRLYYYRARYYDSTRSRFVSEDPIGWDGGINFYAYTLNNPMNSADPEGLSTVAAGAIVGGAVAGPPGAVVGGMVGLIGGILIADWIWREWIADDAARPSDTSTSSDSPGDQCRSDRWTCIVRGNVTPIGRSAVQATQMQATGSGPTREAAVYDGTRKLQKMAPRGSHIRHIHPIRCWKR